MDITFYGNDNHKDLIERTGARYKKYSYYPEKAFKQSSLNNIHLKFSLATVCYGLLDFSDKILPELIEDAEREKPDLIIYDTMALHARFLLRSLELRYKNKISNLKRPKGALFFTTLVIEPDLFPTIIEPTETKTIWYYMHFIFVRFLQFLFSLKHGLDIYDTYGFVFNRNEELKIVTVIPDFQPKVEKFENFKFTGYCVSENIRKFEIQDPKFKSFMDLFEPINPLQTINLQPKNDLKLVYASLGTVFNDNMFIFEDIIEAIRIFDEESDNSRIKSSQIRMMIATGKNVYEKFEKKIKGENFQLPDNVILLPFAPQIDILQRASLFITHSGMNSATEAIFYGVPVICVPLIADQPFVAQRMVDLNLGRKLKPLELTPQKIRKEIHEVLSNDSYLESSIKFSEIARKTNGLQNGAKFIMDYLNNDSNKKDN